MLDKYADELRKAREKKGITLQQMAAKTRIDLKFLEAIDNGNFSFLPELYVKAFIKQYAKVVGLDEKEAIERFEDAREGRWVDKEENKSLLERKLDIDKKKEKEVSEKNVKTFTDVSSSKSPVESGKRNKTAVTIVGSVSATIVVFLIIYFMFLDKSSEIIVEEKPYDQVLQETRERYSIVKEEEPETTAEINDSLTLQITNVDSVDKVWIMVIYDDKSKEDFMLSPRQSKTVRTLNNFKFTLGNSGVVMLKLNNNQLNFEGRKRSVRHFKADSTGLERLYSPPILKIE